jgi:hypothetical protein
VKARDLRTSIGGALPAAMLAAVKGALEEECWSLVEPSGIEPLTS